MTQSAHGTEVGQREGKHPVGPGASCKNTATMFRLSKNYSDQIALSQGIISQNFLNQIRPN